MTRLLFTGLVLSMALLLCTATSAAASPAWYGTASVSGTVVDINTMTPVAGATVRAYPETYGARVAGVAKTDANGAFTINGLRGGPYRLQFDRSGYQHTAMLGIDVPPGGRLIEASPMAMYPEGAPVPKAASASSNVCAGLVQPGETSDVYVVCGDQ